MLQRKLAQMIGAMAGAGLLGMAAAYWICGTAPGGHVGLGALFSPNRPGLESAAPTSAEIDGIRCKILAGGSAGVWIGLAVSACAARRKINPSS